jgi:hypothetical protein
MSTSIDTTIATALRHYLAAQIGAGPTARAFFRLEGFSEATYRDLLTALALQGSQIAGRTIVARSIALIAGHAEVAMESDRSATWYRTATTCPAVKRCCSFSTGARLMPRVSKIFTP